jgi:CRP-like cAMP-binding protein
MELNHLKEMNNNNVKHNGTDNRLLASLPAREWARLLPSLEPIELKLRQPVYEPGLPFRHAYFPEHGLISVVAMMDDGDSIEVGTIGAEGMTGLPLLSDGASPYRHFVQIEGRALRMPAHVLRDETQLDTPLRRLLLRYQSAFVTQLMQSVACNGLHNVQERCARWLLRCLDRAETADVMITHEFLAQMLGVRRASISDVLRPLQQDGLIRSRRGMVSVLDRKGLEGQACECYQVISLEYDRVMRGPL